MTLTEDFWFITIALGVGTFLIRFSFLGLIGDRPSPPFILRLLRYTPVAVLPAMVAPLVLWPTATGGAVDPPRLIAGIATFVVGYLTKSLFGAIGAGVVTLYAGLWLTGGI